MMNQALLWPTFFALVASAAAWLPGGAHRELAVALRSSRLKSMAWQKNDENHSLVGDFKLENVTTIVKGSRRNLFRSAFVSAIGVGGCGTTTSLCSAAHAYTVDRVDPDENDIYAEAQNMAGPLKVLWVGSGALRIKTGGARSGVYKNLFMAGNEVIAVDLLEATPSNIRDAQKYATEQGYKLRYQQGDATELKFDDETFDVVVCSCFLSQPFDPVVVVKEIRRVLKPGGRFGFFEHVEDIDTVVVGKVFGAPSVIKIVAYPELQNIMAGVVKKI